MATIEELRTVCNNNELSCRDDKGKFLPKKELIQLLEKNNIYADKITNFDYDNIEILDEVSATDMYYPWYHDNLMTMRHKGNLDEFFTYIGNPEAFGLGLLTTAFNNRNFTDYQKNDYLNLVTWLVENNLVDPNKVDNRFFLKSINDEMVEHGLKPY
jgi:hypothetical protein